MNFSGLTNAMSTILGLSIHGRVPAKREHDMSNETERTAEASNSWIVPVGVVENNSVSTSQVNS
jgi:hypothetical protein